MFKYLVGNTVFETVYRGSRLSIAIDDIHGLTKKSLKNPIEGEEDDVKKEIFDVLDKNLITCRCKFNGGV